MILQKQKFNKYNITTRNKYNITTRLNLSPTVHETLLPTSTCTPPHDDYDYDCDVNRGPTFNHAHTGVSLLPWPSTTPVDVLVALLYVS